MMSTNEVEIKWTLKLDEKGLIGRECPKCNKYFKIKPVESVVSSNISCPYCDYPAAFNKFFTCDQKEHLLSVAAYEVVNPAIERFQGRLRGLENSCGPLKVTVRTDNVQFKIKPYREKILETQLVCTSCKTEFAIYGVFSNCPVCMRLNALVILTKSLELCEKKLKLCEETSIDEEIRISFKEDCLNSAVAAFDSFGKALRNKYPKTFPAQPNNLFQNIANLDKCLQVAFGKKISDFIGSNGAVTIFKMFQVRHLYIHNSGVIDNNFITSIPSYAFNFGKKYGLETIELRSFIAELNALGKCLYAEVE
ncbi:MAG: hypothetical protein NT141_04505 [candidate division WWE3 bacterium]|nr:hypothetical protein [candidate division WWE3 bacterium]